MPPKRKGARKAAWGDPQSPSGGSRTAPAGASAVDDAVVAVATNPHRKTASPTPKTTTKPKAKTKATPKAKPTPKSKAKPAPKSQAKKASAAKKPPHKAPAAIPKVHDDTGAEPIELEEGDTLLEQLQYNIAVLTRSSTGTGVLAAVAIVMSLTSIVTVSEAYAQFQRDVTGLRSIVETWERPPLVDVAALPGHMECSHLDASRAYGASPSGAGWYGMSALTWPGAVSGNCACPSTASDSFGNSQDSSFSDCNGNQTDAGCESFPSFPALKLGNVFGDVQLCGRQSGTASYTEAGGDRPVPSASGSCPAGKRLCGVVSDTHTGVPSWNSNRALCFDESLPCPLRNVIVARTLDMLLGLGVTSFAGDLSSGHTARSGDTLLLFNGTHNGSAAANLEITLHVNASAGLNATVEFLVAMANGSAAARASNRTLSSVSVADSLEWDFAALLSRSSTDQLPQTPIVFAVPSAGGQVCLHSRPNQPRGFAGPGKGGFNEFDSTCSADDADERWAHTGTAAMQPVLQSAFSSAPLCATNTSLARRLLCSECYSFDSVCTALACDTGCSVLQTYADAEDGIGTQRFSPVDDPILDPPVTIALRREAFWSSDCPNSRREMLDVLEPLEGIETLQRDAVILVAVLSSIAIVFSALQLFTLHDEGMFGVSVCLPLGLALHKYGRKPCGVTDRCLGDRITQRIVIGFGSVMTGLPMGLAKAIFLSVVTAQLGSVRGVLSVWGDGSVQCSDEAQSNDALQRLGASIGDTFTNNLVAIVIECVLVVSSASGAVAELTDGHALCQKTIAEAEEL